MGSVRILSSVMEMAQQSFSLLAWKGMMIKGANTWMSTLQMFIFLLLI